MKAEKKRSEEKKMKNLKLRYFEGLLRKSLSFPLMPPDEYIKKLIRNIKKYKS